MLEDSGSSKLPTNVPKRSFVLSYTIEGSDSLGGISPLKDPVTGTTPPKEHGPLVCRSDTNSASRQTNKALMCTDSVLPLDLSEPPKEHEHLICHDTPEVPKCGPSPCQIHREESTRRLLVEPCHRKAEFGSKDVLAISLSIFYILYMQFLDVGCDAFIILIFIYHGAWYYLVLTLATCFWGIWVMASLAADKLPYQYTRNTDGSDENLLCTAIKEALQQPNGFQDLLKQAVLGAQKLGQLRSKVLHTLFDHSTPSMFIQATALIMDSKYEWSVLQGGFFLVSLTMSCCSFGLGVKCLDDVNWVRLQDSVVHSAFRTMEILSRTMMCAMLGLELASMGEFYHNWSMSQVLWVILGGEWLLLLILLLLGCIDSQPGVTSSQIGSGGPRGGALGCLHKLAMAAVMLLCDPLMFKRVEQQFVRRESNWDVYYNLRLLEVGAILVFMAIRVFRSRDSKHEFWIGHWLHLIVFFLALVASLLFMCLQRNVKQRYVGFMKSNPMNRTAYFPSANSFRKAKTKKSEWWSPWEDGELDSSQGDESEEEDDNLSDSAESSGATRDSRELGQWRWL